MKNMVHLVKSLSSEISKRRELHKRQHKWNCQWAKPDYHPIWRLRGRICEPLVQSIADKWLNPDMQVLDIGCGDGEIATWLGKQGFKVDGVDFAKSAIERARKTCSDKNVSFKKQDVCREK